MPRDNGHDDPASSDDDDAPVTGEGAAEYDAMLLLDQLETLEEDMVDLGVSTLDEVRQRIAALHAEMDE